METVVKCKILIKSKPISTNSAYYKRNRAFNEATRRWRFNFFSQLQSDYNQNQMNKIKDVFNPKKHMIRVSFTWFQPLEFILTKSGELSLRSMDVDNCLKIPTDCLFDKKYNNNWLKLRKTSEKTLYKPLTSLINLDINDKFIFSTQSIKCPSLDDNFHCEIVVEVVSLFSTGS